MIYGFCKAGFTITEIADELGRHKSTIIREVKRNSGLRGYRPKQADEKAIERKRTSFKATKWTPELEQIIVLLLQQKWSPEQISERIKIEYGLFISHQRIYEFVNSDKRNGGELYTYLRQGKKKRRKKYGKTASKRGQIQDRVSIHERPAVIENREEYGHWEGDTIIGKNRKKAMITLVERKGGFSIIRKVESKNANNVAKEIVKAVQKYKVLIKSITFDNGLEFAEHKMIAKALKCMIYFAEPYSSYQRGTNENTNGLIRQYFPKGTDFDNYSVNDVEYAMNSLNSRPRKRLNYFTPAEIFFKKRVALTC
jgi:IS30 family transposase